MSISRRASRLCSLWRSRVLLIGLETVPALSQIRGRRAGRSRCLRRRQSARRFESARRRRRPLCSPSSRRSPIRSRNSHPTQELQTYLDRCRRRSSKPPTKILAGKNATDHQLIDAIEWKIESLRIRQKLGDTKRRQADRRFLASLNFDDRRLVADAVEGNPPGAGQGPDANRPRLQMELMTKLRQWQQLDAAQRETPPIG